MAYVTGDFKHDDYEISVQKTKTMYTIKDLSEGKVAVINDGLLADLQKLIDLTIHGYDMTGFWRYYWIENDELKSSDKRPKLPVQSVKDFLVEPVAKDSDVWEDLEQEIAMVVANEHEVGWVMELLKSKYTINKINHGK